METETEKPTWTDMGDHKTKILFVDDRWKRIEWALETYKNWNLFIAPNAKEALRLMSSQNFDVVSLDHDLSGCDFEDPESPTCGMEIVRYIAKTGWPPMRQKPVFWIHSSNLFAAHLMEISLIELGFECYYQPIRYVVEHMTYDKTGLPK
jgi:CheY-like chemotaxis protein